MSMLLCTSCGLDFEEAEYRVHVLNNCKAVKCPNCPQFFGSEAAALRHVRAVHNKEFVCSICQKVVATNFSLKKHMAFVHNIINNKKPIQCEQCGEIFVTKFYLKRHIQGVHNKEFVCTECGNEFKKLVGLRKHLHRVHKKEKITCVSQVPCPKCGKLVAKTFVERHILNKHSKEIDKSSLICHVCERECPSETALQKHINAKHPEENSAEALLKRKFKCPHCVQRFTSADVLQWHIKGIHEGLLRCDLCNQDFSRPSSLVKHKWRMHKVKVDYKTITEPYVKKSIPKKKKENDEDNKCKSTKSKATQKNFKCKKKGEKPKTCKSETSQQDFEDDSESDEEYELPLKSLEIKIESRDHNDEKLIDENSTQIAVKEEIG